MKRDKIMTVMLTKDEEQQIMSKIREQFASGQCRNKSDFIRQALAAYCANGTNPANNPTKEANPDETPQTNSKDSDQLNNAFANLDI